MHFDARSHGGTGAFEGSDTAGECPVAGLGFEQLLLKVSHRFPQEFYCFLSPVEQLRTVLPQAAKRHQDGGIRCFTLTHEKGCSGTTFPCTEVPSEALLGPSGRG